jgi:ornithine decarboxylase
VLSNTRLTPPPTPPQSAPRRPAPPPLQVAACYPGVGLVLRLRCDDPEALVPLGLKYGADPSEAPRLLAAAAALGLRVVGASFHVGSSCQNLAAFDAAIAAARRAFDAGAAAGHDMTLLDVGGGFTGRFDGHGHVVFGDIARTINAALSAHFPADGGPSGRPVRVIAEPGRFFAETSACLAAPVYGRRDRPAPGGGAPHKDYWLTDGLYGSFNCILYDSQRPRPHVLRSPLLPPLAEGGGPEAPGVAPTFSSTLWGPTCDSADFIYKGVQLPELRTGDWLLFPDTGARRAGAGGWIAARTRQGEAPSPAATLPHGRGSLANACLTPLPLTPHPLCPPAHGPRCLHRRGRLRLQWHWHDPPQQVLRVLSQRR